MDWAKQIYRSGQVWSVPQTASGLVTLSFKHKGETNQVTITCAAAEDLMEMLVRHTAMVRKAAEK
jgi:hypothetical protein